MPASVASVREKTGGRGGSGRVTRRAWPDGWKASTCSCSGCGRR